jgi:DNA-binding NtrC family response regulator
MVETVRRIARTRLPVLVLGETGSGKERVARAIHAWGRRPSGPFVAFNCAAISESLFEAELFGVVRGAYTGADRDREGLLREATGGTLFLDEIGDLPASMQPKLLRALESGKARPVGGPRELEVDCRLVAATHRDLRSRVRSGAFREDLLHRIAVTEVRVPSLRERPEDLPRIIDSLSSRLLSETGFGPIRLSPGALDDLSSRPWPGNIRQLHATLARALIDSAGATVEPRHLSPRPHEGRELPELERRMIELALSRSGGVIAYAARRIGWSRQKLYRRIRVLGISYRREAVVRQSPLRSEPPAAASGTRSSKSSTFQ